MTPFTAFDLVSAMNHAYGPMIHPELDLQSESFRVRLRNRWRMLFRLG